MAFPQKLNVDVQIVSGRKLPVTLDQARIRSLPGDAFYIPEFITAEEEQRLLQKVGPSRDTSLYIFRTPLHVVPFRDVFI